mmetsp:Transcript_21890/g.33699  ORF Transcript_21890/g.33699 Transcript_21890/m.33699 type:complete len:390 (-) Transcript_21890:119-1288(-)|eukprot:CAMPEP_0195282338 /NCGR_PEP_ID=MMETSP0707-20130614/1255_1 /TAXON_ID=33640 /ORGANISM="Asterionellopsis glacialis, Strain CCMP134" /LENGTH=389 /DNA_ID=CAMNT_0040341301 /DNA_START=200 /DNA_END=1369 /DNA_ORIENTATION=-
MPSIANEDRTALSAAHTFASRDENCISKENRSPSSSPMRNHDGTPMLNHDGTIIYKSQYLSTNPLRSDCKERLGWNNSKITYMTGDAVIRIMNSAFSHEGWSTEIVKEREVQCELQNDGRWHVGYIASVRITLQSGTSHEDCGTGEGHDENKLVAHDKALKTAITDAMKRAARHFGEKLGNALYVQGNALHKLPHDNKKALRELQNREVAVYGPQEQYKKVQRNRKSDQTTEQVVGTATTPLAVQRTAQQSATSNSFPHRNHSGPGTVTPMAARPVSADSAEKTNALHTRQPHQPDTSRNSDSPNTHQRMMGSRTAASCPNGSETLSPPEMFYASTPDLPEDAQHCINAVSVAHNSSEAAPPVSNQRSSYQSPRDPKRQKVSARNPYQR